MDFHEITVEDGRWARPLLEARGYAACDYTFTNVYMWHRVYKTTIARFEDFAVTRGLGSPGQAHYLYPSGRGDVKRVLNAILEDAAALGRNPVLFPLSSEAMDELEALYPGQFYYENIRGETDYIYLSSDLADLPGRKYQKKRNHCSRFERLYDGQWQFSEITHESLDEVCAFNNRWCRLYDNRGIEGIEEEHRAIRLAFQHYDEMKLKGGALTVNGEMAAFSFGSPVSGDMFVTHVEKALYDISGAYNIINREMARAFGRGYTYINRENDVGDEGLREAKMSYHPARLEEKHSAELISGMAK